jgi:hypothetical protein
MSVLSYLDSFNVSTGAIGTTMARTGYGFSPKALIVWGFGRTESISASGSAAMTGGIGMAVSPSSRVFGFFADTNGDASPEFTVSTNLTSVFFTSGGSMDLQSIDSDGATFIIDAVFPTAYRVHVLAIGGHSITNAALMQITGLSSFGTKAHTGLGFQPNAGIFLAASSSGTTNISSTFSIGAAAGPSGSIVQRCTNTNGLDSLGDASANTSTSSALNIAAFSVRAGGTPSTGSVQSWDSDGMTVFWQSGTDIRTVHVLALKTAANNYFSVHEVTTVNNTSTDINISNAANRPTFGLVGSYNGSATIGSLSLGAFTGVSNAFHYYDSANAAGSSSVRTQIDFEDCMGLAASMEMRTHTINPNGVTFRMSSASLGSQTGVWVLLGGAPSRPRGAPLIF